MKKPLQRDFRQESVEHMMLYHNIGMFRSPPFIIVRGDDAQKKEKAQSQQNLTPSEREALENDFKTDVRPWKFCANKVRTLASL